MIPRYTRPEMGAIWGDQRRFQTWLEVELAATEALADAGVVPAADARALRERASFDIARIQEIEETTQHDVIAFTTAVAERAGPPARWLHFGLTSSDVIDTAQALQVREACDLILADIDGLARAIRERAVEHRRTPMIGRTHGVHAEPMTFGVKLALWYAEVARDRARVARARETMAVGKISGAVGMFATSTVSAAVCHRLVWRRARVVTGHPAGPARRAHDSARDHGGIAREVRDGSSRAAEDGNRRGRGAVRAGPEGLVGHAP
jgi:adenylosuccinate lyase